MGSGKESYPGETIYPDEGTVCDASAKLLLAGVFGCTVVSLPRDEALHPDLAEVATQDLYLDHYRFQHTAPN